MSIETKSRIIEVRPVEKKRWHGKTGKESFANPITIEAPVSKRTGQYATGLSPEDRARLEKITGFNLSPDFSITKAHEFWTTADAQVKLENRTNIFDISKPRDEIKVAILRASDLVANSVEELEKGLFPEALFVIFNEAEEIESKASKAAVKRKVVIDASKLSLERKAEIVQIMLNISVRKQSENFIDLKMDEAIEKDCNKVLNLIQRNKTTTALHALVLEALHRNVLRKDGAAIYYMDDQLGYDVESTVEYFLDVKNQTLKAQILEKLN
jgi:hypothetical protein